MVHSNPDSTRGFKVSNSEIFFHLIINILNADIAPDRTEVHLLDIIAIHEESNYMLSYVIRSVSA